MCISFHIIPQFDYQTGKFCQLTLLVFFNNWMAPLCTFFPIQRLQRCGRPCTSFFLLFSDYRCCCCSTHSKSNSCYTKARSEIFLGRFKVAYLASTVQLFIVLKAWSTFANFVRFCSDFSDIFDADYFISSLSKDVKIIQQLPDTISKKSLPYKIRVPRKCTPLCYDNRVLPALLKKNVSPMVSGFYVTICYLIQFHNYFWHS